MNNTEKFIVQKGVEHKTIPLICSWCRHIINVKEWEIERDKKISPDFGICPRCLKKISRSNKQLCKRQM
ncbi:MAG: hypothetical protein A2X48_00330 [Lentisphaerae bacterium GWF2_49_21]|nr:MAG: hypothetical protein A2X48_00330 [Lentisphaerae bacterium GWF2_49_21]